MADESVKDEHERVRFPADPQAAIAVIAALSKSPGGSRGAPDDPHFCKAGPQGHRVQAPTLAART